MNCALACVPAPRLPAAETVTDAERGAAVHDVASAIASSLPYLTEEDRRELATALLAGLPERSEAFLLVLECHRSFDLPINDTTRTNSALRSNLILEEAHEVVGELVSGDKAALAKELADLVYVTYGTAVTEGIDLDGAVREVHRSNMTKLIDGRPVMRPDGKFLKGPNYRPPDMAPFVTPVAQ